MPSTEEHNLHSTEWGKDGFIRGIRLYTSPRRLKTDKADKLKTESTCRGDRLLKMDLSKSSQHLVFKDVLVVLVVADGSEEAQNEEDGQDNDTESDERNIE
uniref:Uncharacterized protein n=1 Tax=Steinernema glaseri TaxID=37863 RepID=A0A1I8A938_9BILA